jgi:hypothetical protein
MGLPRLMSSCIHIGYGATPHAAASGQPAADHLLRDNPPGPASGGTIERVWRGHVYEREVGPSDLLDAPEAAAALGLRHVFSVYRAIWDGRLEAIQRVATSWFP